MVFSGHSLIAEDGTMLAESRLFREGFTATDIDVERLAQERCRMTTFVERGTADYRVIPFSLKAAGDLPHLAGISPCVPLSRTTGRTGTGAAGKFWICNAPGFASAFLMRAARRWWLGFPAGWILPLRCWLRCAPLTAWGEPERYRGGDHALLWYDKSGQRPMPGALRGAWRDVPYGGYRGSGEPAFQDIGHDPAVLDVTYENAQRGSARRS